MLRWTSGVRVKPANKFCVDDLQHVVSRVATPQPRQDGSRLGFILVRVRVAFKIYSDWIVPIEERGRAIEQFPVFGSESATILQDFIAGACHVV